MKMVSLRQMRGMLLQRIWPQRLAQLQSLGRVGWDASPQDGDVHLLHLQPAVVAAWIIHRGSPRKWPHAPVRGQNSGPAWAGQQLRPR